MRASERERVRERYSERARKGERERERMRKRAKGMLVIEEWANRDSSVLHSTCLLHKHYGAHCVCVVRQELLESS